ncbi:MAG: DUF222 domain-containing protein [Actinomycetota bacterium]|nr:DUF222 domain-containing protein [Actinomycetota bacterium]
MKVAELSGLLEGLELDADPGSLRDAIACFDRFSALLADAVGEFDGAKLFELDGFTSTNMFLRHAGLGESAAARLTATGRRMVACPVTAEAYRSGGLRSGHVDAIVANTPERVLGQYAAQEDEFVPAIAALTTRGASTVMRRWRSYAEDALDAKRNETDTRREVSFSITANGRGELRGSFDPATAELIKTGLERFEVKNNPNEPARTAKQRRADALRDIFTYAVENGDDTSGTAGRHRPHVTIMVNANDGDAWNLNGEPLSGPIVTSWLCDSLVNRLVMDADGVPLDYGRSERTAPTALWKAVATRDGGCRFPGCDRPPRWCQAHHLKHWTEGGCTDLDNLALLCTHHHHLVHEKGWVAKLLPDLTLEVTGPDGRVHSSRPRGIEPPRLL